jgi:Tfp pilus assembly protein FimT
MRKQRGITLVSLIVVGALIFFVLLIGMKLLPSYIEYFKVQNHMKELMRSPEMRDATPQALRSAFDRRATIDDITVITGKDIEISGSAPNYTLSASWSTRVPLVGNVSACIDFQSGSE